MKIIKESNELEKRKKKHNKTDRKGAKGWFVHPDGGNPYSLASFNNQVSMSDGSIGSVSLGEDLEEDTYELHDPIFDNIVIQRGKDVSKKDGDLEFNLWWHKPSLNLNWYPIIQIDLNDEPIYNAEGPENPDHWKDFVREAIKKATSKNKYEIKPNKDLAESKKKNIYEIVYINSMDKSAHTIVHAYSKNQAALVCRKQNRGEVYRIVSIECIKDNSIDDGEQLSLFDEDMKFKSLDLVETIVPNEDDKQKQQDYLSYSSKIEQLINESLPFYLQERDYKKLISVTALLLKLLKKMQITVSTWFSIEVKDPQFDARTLAKNYIERVDGVINFVLYSDSDKDLAEGYFQVDFDKNEEVIKEITSSFESNLHDFAKLTLK